VHSSVNLIEINHLKNLLEAGGVRCVLRNQLLTGIAGEVPFDQAAAQLWVLDDAELWQAEEILRDWRRARFARGPAWVCSECGERHEGQFSQCWKCGAEKAAP
jgi:rubrerythrin